LQIVKAPPSDNSSTQTPFQPKQIIGTKFFDAVEKCVRLESLQLIHCNPIDNWSLLRKIQKLPLKRLRIAGEHYISCFLVDPTKSLRSLSIFVCLRSISHR
jgi:hypothetical protein